MNFIHFIQKHHYSFLAFLFLFFYTFAYTYVSYDEKNRVNTELVNKLEISNIEYKLIYNIYKKNSRLIFNKFINTPTTLALLSDINSTNKAIKRKKLYKNMKTVYTLARKLGTEQLHFHLPNNESFLRMHAPKKYGDNLTHFRYSIKYVNEFHKKISGFEQGKIIDGFRFVYSLDSKTGKHLGSVEVSVSSSTFKTLFENRLYTEAYFLVEKKVSQNKLFEDELKKHYDQSLDSVAYLQNKRDAHVLDVNEYMKEHTDIYQNLLQPHLETQKAFAIDLAVKEHYYVKVFIPIKNIQDNRVVAYFVTTIPSEIMQNIHKDALYVKIVLFFFLLLIIYAIHKNLIYAQALRNEIEKKTKELKESEQKIIEAKKMASLGTLVAGIAHEINTPVGLSITAMSNLIEQTKILQEHYDKEEMDQEEFENYLKKSESTRDLIFTNLVRTANLIKDFKQISINEEHEEKRVIHLKQHFEHLISTIAPQLEKHNIRVLLNINEKLQLETYVNSLDTVIRNLILNSIIHAFKNTEDAIITIDIMKSSHITTIVYTDNGCGMNENQVKNVYEPFFTTDRGSGGSGLGMHITFNLITQKLGGEISLQSVIGSGVKYTIMLKDNKNA